MIPKLGDRDHLYISVIIRNDHLYISDLGWLIPWRVCGDAWLVSALQIWTAGAGKVAGETSQAVWHASGRPGTHSLRVGLGGYFTPPPPFPLTYLAFLSSGLSFHGLLAASWS